MAVSKNCTLLFLRLLAYTDIVCSFHIFAAEKADIAIVTDDNPRSEDPAAIRAQVMAASPKLREIGDRAEAIRAGVAMLAPGDVLVVAGKGHETGQIIGDRTLPFSDHETVRQAVAEISGRR